MRMRTWVHKADWAECIRTQGCRKIWVFLSPGCRTGTCGSSALVYILHWVRLYWCPLVLINHESRI